MTMFCCLVLTSFILHVVPSLVLTKPTRNCVEPDVFETFTFEQFHTNTKAQSYSITPGWYEDMESADKVPSEYIDISHKHYYGKLKCKKQKSKGNGQDNTLNDMSQCMWRYVENTDKNRKPETLLEVDCICSHPLYTKKKSKLVCQTVIEYVIVFRKIGCRHGTYEYKRVWEPRAVACVASVLPEPKRLYSIAHKTSM